MIVWDLDGTLADCEHRRHFVQAPEDHCWKCHEYLMNPESIKEPLFVCSCGRQPGIWRCDYKAFYEACDKDKPIQPVRKIIKELYGYDYYDSMEDVHIWSGRCESVRKKTEEWLKNHCIYYNSLKMRPIGDNTPDEILKEKWLDEAIAQGKTIEMVFDDRPKVIRMWRRRGIFVFNCCQNEEEF